MYSDPEFQITRSSLPPVVTGTATASATTGVAVTVAQFAPTTAINITKIRVFVVVAPKTANMGLTATVLNGTNTVGVAVLGTNVTAGTFKDATLTAANQLVAADSYLKVVITGTATASADTIGTMQLQFDATEPYS